MWAERIGQRLPHPRSGRDALPRLRLATAQMKEELGVTIQRARAFEGEVRSEATCNAELLSKLGAVGR